MVIPISDCSTKAWKLQSENAKSYLDGFSKGISDVEERLNHLRELEQRYQQLEQVVKRMYRYIKKDADESWSPVKEKVEKHYREEIEALGVSLDD